MQLKKKTAQYIVEKEPLFIDFSRCCIYFRSVKQQLKIGPATAAFYDGHFIHMN
jgi:hypothetical protein